ncbi:hypothetical protein, partial [Candidatus Anaplasma sp. TIGMIC]|uniref:hypothetical protein n=1 Tax=Candidatus Anaplasma sp. TIGMIC TaxID=3020713 RepID=UPI00232F610B
KKVPDVRRILIELSESDEMWAYGAACGVAAMSFITLLCRAMKKAMCIFKEESRVQVDDVVHGPECAEEVSSEVFHVSGSVRAFDTMCGRR